MARRAGVQQQPAADGLDLLQHDIVPPTIGANPAEHALHDEL